MTEINETLAAAQLGMFAAAPVKIVDGKALAFRELNGSINVVDTERWEPRPFRTRRTSIEVTEVESLVAYVCAQAEAGHFEVWADEPSQSVIAVLNAPAGPEVPGWCDHRATLKLRRSPEWMAWLGASGKLIGQEEFAEFIEDHAADIVRPEPAIMLELAQSFHATNKVAFESTRMLDSGRRALEFRENLEAKAGRKGEIEIPSIIDLGLRPWEGCERYRIAARFRYRISDGDLRIGVKLVDPEALLRAAFADVVAAIEVGVELQAYRGRP